ncbi:MAG: S8 family peptidase [Hyphomicrobiales bacterium]|nr:S8 family peptidase [Hyphomicrobiales bacterium]
MSAKPSLHPQSSLSYDEKPPRSGLPFLKEIKSNMAEFDHLPLVRLPRLEPHRKTGGFPPPPSRNRKVWGARIRSELDRAVVAQVSRQAIPGIDPSLILKVSMTSNLAEEEWRRSGFQILAQDRARVLILFSTDLELTEFRRRLESYQSGPLTDKGNPSHNGLLAHIENVESISPEDRLGPRIQQQGIESITSIDGRKSFIVDVEVWSAESRLSCEVRTGKIIEFVETEGGDVRSKYVGETGVIVLRIALKGALLRKLCHVTEIALIDLPPRPDFGPTQVSGVTISDVGTPKAPPPTAPLIGIIDSGLSKHPLLEMATIDSFGVPQSLGDADTNGHGSRVAGIALYGDVYERVTLQDFAAPFGIISARVVNDQGRFDDKAVIAEQMENALKELHARGCRIVNISLGDADKIAYADGRATPWAATLDRMTRSLDILVIVSAGNSANGTRAPWGNVPDGIVTGYPRYLFEPDNRIIDPAMAACVLTVGSLAHGNGLRIDPFETVDIRPLTERDHPTPITRVGPGINGALKPELVDYGGTAVFNGGTQKLMVGADWDSAGIVTLRANYRDALFTAATGTSMAAPRVAFKAALLLRRFPDASANLLRALLATCASIPDVTIKKLEGAADDAARRCCGYGTPNVEKALSSEERRIIRFADRQTLEIDQFALYEVPIPEDFRRVKGRRHIRVTLAFDPPVRHTRLEYLGVRMSFRLIRGMKQDQIYEHYKQRPKGEAWPDLPNCNKCKLDPGYDARSTGTLQSATLVMKRGVETYGDTYYLAVFADRRWAGQEILSQSYAAIVELMHEGEVKLYQQSRLREEERQRARQRNS